MSDLIGSKVLYPLTNSKEYTVVGILENRNAFLVVDDNGEFHMPSILSCKLSVNNGKREKIKVEVLITLDHDTGEIYSVHQNNTDSVDLDVVVQDFNTEVSGYNFEDDEFEDDELVSRLERVQVHPSMDNPLWRRIFDEASRKSINCDTDDDVGIIDTKSPEDTTPARRRLTIKTMADIDRISVCGSSFTRYIAWPPLKTMANVEADDPLCR